MIPEIKGHLKKKLRTWLRAKIISDMTSNIKISVTILKIWFQVFFLASEVKFDLGGQRTFRQKLCTWSMKLTEKVLSRYLNRFWSYMRLKSINWPQRSSLTSRVKGHFNIKLRTWSMNLIGKILFRYLKRIWSYMRLKFTFWPQRSKLTSEVKGHNVNLLGYIRRVNIQNFVKIGPL